MEMKKMMMISLLLSASSWTMAAAKPAELLKGYNKVHAPTASAQKVAQTVKNTANNATQAVQNTASSVKNTASTSVKNATTNVKNTAQNTVQNATQAVIQTANINNNNAVVMNQEALNKLEEMVRKTAILEKQLEETQKRNTALQQQLAEINKTNTNTTRTVAVSQDAQQVQKTVDKKVSEARKKANDTVKKSTDATKKAQETVANASAVKLNSLTPAQKMEYLKQVQQTYQDLLQTQNQDISDINRLQQKLSSAQKKLEDAKLQVDKLNAELMISQDIQAEQYRKLQSTGAELNQAWKAVYGESSTPPRLTTDDTSKKI